MLTVASSLMALAFQLTPLSTTPGNAYDELRQLRFEGFQPRFSVAVSEGSARGIWAIYEQHGNETGVVTWVVRREIITEGHRRSEIARSDTCPAVYSQVLAMERMPTPRAETRGPRSTSPQGFEPAPPNLGPLHRSYVLSATGWTQGSEPVGLAMFHLGSGPIADWMAGAEIALQSCWSEEIDR